LREEAKRRRHSRQAEIVHKLIEEGLLIDEQGGGA